MAGGGAPGGQQREQEQQHGLPGRGHLDTECYMCGQLTRPAQHTMSECQKVFMVIIMQS